MSRTRVSGTFPAIGGGSIGGQMGGVTEKDTQPDVGNARMNPARPALLGGQPWRCFPCLFGFDQLPLFGFAAAENAITYSAICCAGFESAELRAPNWIGRGIA